MSLEESEREKYRAVWEYEPYRDQSDGVPVVGLAIAALGCRPGETIIDWGCGTGISSVHLQSFGLEVTGYDIAPNCLNAGIYVPLVVGNLWEPPEGLMADYGFCTDVLEHIPTELMGQVLVTLYERSRRGVYIQVDTAADLSGPLMDPPQTLHLTVKPAEWWADQLGRCDWTGIVQYPGAYSRVGFACLK